MTGSTDHYGLSRLLAGDNWSDDGYKYTDYDRQLIDRLLHLGAEGHHHNAAVAAVVDPTVAPSLVTADTGGTIPAGSRVYYKYTFIDQNGFESAGSAESYVDTPAAVLEPSAPVSVVSTTLGALLPGVHYYVLTAYTTVNTQETKGLNPTYVTIPVGTTTNKVTLTLPTLPTGADGFNIYSKKPGASRYNHLTSVASGTTTFVDDGSVLEDCNRTIPSSNNTNASNTVTVTIPTLAAGTTWKLYRSFSSGSYESSLLHWVVEETAEGSGIITPVYVDIGSSTFDGQPPTASQAIGGPSKINLATEATGDLPIGLIAFPVEFSFFYPGTLATTLGSSIWTCEYPNLKIIGVRLTLGRGSVPASTPVLVDVNRGPSNANPTFTTIFTDQANRPTVPVGATRGARAVPAVTDFVLGDMVTVDIDQVGGGAATDMDLTIKVYGIAYGYNETVVFNPAAPNIP